MEEIIVIGGGGHAKVLISLLGKLGTYAVLGYTDNVRGEAVLAAKYLGEDGELGEIKKKHPRAAAAIGFGGVEISEERARMKARLEALGYVLPAIVSPHAVVNEGVEIGKGTVVFDGVIIQTGTRIGECAILNTACSIDHDCVIGDFVHIAPGVTLSGGVKVGRNCIVGAGATVIQYRTVGADCLIGAGATVIEDCLEPGVYVGTPARRKQTEPYAI
jgi:UDP-perosamine 4-acetyltransferase